MRTCEMHSWCEPALLFFTRAAPLCLELVADFDLDALRKYPQWLEHVVWRQEDMLGVAPFPQQLLQDSRKGDPAFVEQRRVALEVYLVQLLAKIEVLLE